MNELTMLDFVFYSYYYLKAKLFAKPLEEDNGTEE